MLKDPKLGQKLAFFGVFYLVFAVCIFVGYWLRDYIRPVASLIFPINDKPFTYNFVVMSAFYWGVVILMMAINKDKS